MDFKKGDWVVCVDALNTPALTYGGLYRVTDGSGDYDVEITDDSGVGVAYYRRRFRAATKSDLSSPMAPVKEPDPSTASRQNKGKIDLTFNPPVALLEMAKVWMDGHYRKGYPKGNWEKLWGDETVNMVLQSIERHVLKIKSGELFDVDDSGLPHAAHLMCNCCMILEYMAKEGLIDPWVFKMREKKK